MDASFIADRCQFFYSFAVLSGSFHVLTTNIKQGHMIQESNARAVQMLDSFMALIAQMIVATSNHSERMAASTQA
jgi:hypothetical protein